MNESLSIESIENTPPDRTTAVLALKILSFLHRKFLNLSRKTQNYILVSMADIPSARPSGNYWDAYYDSLTRAAHISIRRRSPQTSQRLRELSIYLQSRLRLQAAGRAHLGHLKQRCGSLGRCSRRPQDRRTLGRDERRTMPLRHGQRKTLGINRRAASVIA